MLLLNFVNGLQLKLGIIIDFQLKQNGSLHVGRVKVDRFLLAIKQEKWNIMDGLKKIVKVRFSVED